ncbi:MAG: AAA family ATPase [Lachnospiraceae bacterium]
MSEQFIVSISREFGSAGHEIAEKLAKDLGIELYDRKILDEIAAEKQSSVESLEEFDEKPTFFAKKIGVHNSSAENIVAQMQFDYIRRKADSGESFVVVGRCAETVLKGRKNFFRFFILGDRPEKIEHVKNKYGLNDEEALEKMIRHDKKRKIYHNQYSEFKWGDSRGYDMCINSSKLGIDGTVELIKKYLYSLK